MANARAQRTANQLRSMRQAGASTARRRLPRLAPPTAIEREYRAQLFRIVDQSFRALEPLLAALPALFAQAEADRRLDVGESRKVEQLLDQARSRLTVNKAAAEQLASVFAQQISTFQRRQLTRQLRAGLGADPFLGDAKLQGLFEGFVGENVALIRSIPETIATRIEGIVQRGLVDATPHPRIAELIQEETGIARRRARLIARDQVGKLYGQLNKARQQEVGIDAYIWRTVRDERVRVRPHNHRVREGKRFLWSEPPADGHPGQAVNCRCYPEPDLTTILGEAAGPTPPPTVVATPPPARPARVRRPRSPRPPRVVLPPVTAPAVVPAVPVAAPSAGPITAAMHERVRLAPRTHDPAFQQMRDDVDKWLSEQTGGKININAMTHLWAPPEGYKLQVEGITLRNNSVTFSGNILTSSGENAGQLVRNIKKDQDGKLFAYHGYLVMGQKFQGSGVAGKIVDNAIKQYAGLGLDYVKLDAHWVGRYTWARRGFEPYSDDVRSDIRGGLEGYLIHRKMPPEVRKRYLEKFDGQTLQEVSNWDDGKMHPNEYEDRVPSDPEEFKLGKAFMLSRYMPTWEGKLKLKK